MVHPSDRIERTIHFPSVYHITSDPYGARVKYNDAIVGETLYDLSDGRAKKVALAELDLSATEKQNDERGVDFRVPAAMKSN